MEEMQRAIEAVSSPVVQVWINWMMLVFAASIAFIWKQVTARWVLATLVALLPLALLIFRLTGSAHLIGIAHILLWGPLAVLIWWREIRTRRIAWATPFGVWIGLLLATIAISLVFDVRDAVLILGGWKVA